MICVFRIAPICDMWYAICIWWEAFKNPIIGTLISSCCSIRVSCTAILSTVMIQYTVSHYVLRYCLLSCDTLPGNTIVQYDYTYRYRTQYTLESKLLPRIVIFCDSNHDHRTSPFSWLHLYLQWHGVSQSWSLRISPIHLNSVPQNWIWKYDDITT